MLEHCQKKKSSELSPLETENGFCISLEFSGNLLLNLDLEPCKAIEYQLEVPRNHYLDDAGGDDPKGTGNILSNKI